MALIIGNKTYEHERVPDVSYADRDSEAFKAYVIDVLGFDPDNVIELRDASQAELETALGNERSHEGTLWRYLDPDGGSDVIVFYSGHGVPGLNDNSKDKRGYLLPSDADPNTAEINGYPIDVLYGNLARLEEARSVTVYLDSCFSGESHTGMLIMSASPVYVSAELPHEVGDKLTVLTAASAEQLASWDDEARHGLFTHHLLDALYGKGDADGNGRVTAGEAAEYLRRHMTRAARREFGRHQIATMSGLPGVVLSLAVGGVFPSRPQLGITGSGVATTPARGRVKATGTDQIEQDKLVLAMKLAHVDEDHEAVLKYAGDLQQLVEEVPTEARFYQGVALAGVQRDDDAQEVLRAFLREAGRSSDRYEEALSRLLEVEARLAAILEADDAAYAQARAEDTAAAYREYLRAYPRGRHASEAQELIETVRERGDDAAYARARTVDTAAAYAAYLGTYPRGRHASEAKQRQAELHDREDDEAYRRARASGRSAAYSEYLRRFPDGRHAAEARRSRTVARDDEAHEKARSADTEAAYGEYLRAYPRGRHASDARQRQAELHDREDDEAYRQARASGTSAAYSEYLRRFPSGRHVEQARRSRTVARDDEAYEEARSADTEAAYGEYLSRYPNGRHAVEALRKQEERRESEKLRAGTRFRDCDGCPELVVVSGGTFMMGSPQSEKWRTKHEGPRHRVKIDGPFAVGVHEVTFREYGRFVQATGRAMRGSCWQWKDGEWKLVIGTGWKFPGFNQSEQAPVVCVNWDDADAYVKWLSGVTGERYRLLTESEWEYVARAGTSTANFWGNNPKDQCRFANGVDLFMKRKDAEWKWAYAPCSDGHHATAPVGTYSANRFGLHDVLGNVLEWTQDCWHEDYEAAPADGRAWEEGGDCSRRVLRGGAWLSRQPEFRLAYRANMKTDIRAASVGFRVSRVLAD